MSPATSWGVSSRFQTARALGQVCRVSSVIAFAKSAASALFPPGCTASDVGREPGALVCCAGGEVHDSKVRDPRSTKHVGTLFPFIGTPPDCSHSWVQLHLERDVRCGRRKNPE